MRFKRIMYTWKHKVAFIKIHKQLFAHTPLRAYLHDIDKLILMLLMFPMDKITSLHRKYSNHHVNNGKQYSRQDLEMMVVDWECARYTKPDKPLNARETCIQKYPEMKEMIFPILDKLHL